ncbi:MAG: doxx family protein [Bacteroidetes bacterium]|jgi:uncharacterized membrane protein YkgB|nr:MAG: doxx family protein [Bacteroidota bacterium]UCE70322.1 MAG: doxx family protein [Flavobacteriaceae bacterium]
MKQIAAVLSARITRVSFVSAALGVVYLWFGILKFFPGLSPAEELAGTTIERLTLGTLDPEMGVFLLAIWEVGIGLMLLTGTFQKWALWAALVHICCTFTPLLFFPDLCFTKVPFGLTLVGQYIFKNLVFLGVMVILIKREIPK